MPITITAQDLRDQRDRIQADLTKVTDEVRAFADKTNEQGRELQSRVEALEQHAADQATRSTGVTVANDAQADATLHDQQGRAVGVMLRKGDLGHAGTIAARLASVNPRAVADPAAEPMQLTEFVRGIAGMRTSQAVQAALSEGTNSTGGYAVPTVLLPGILSALVPASSLLQAGANVAVLNTQADSFKVAAIDTLPTAAWREENAALAESDPTFRGLTITPHSLAFIFKVSRELLQDAPGMEAALQTAIAAAFAKKLDSTGLYGSGAAPIPLGLKFVAGINEVDAVGALTDYKPFVKARRLIAEADAPMPTAAIVSTVDDETIANLADTTHQPLRRPDALANWQFIASSQMPTDSSGSDAFVGDFSGFTFYMREAVSIQLLKERYADTGQIGFACHVRADCAPAYPKAFAVLKGITE
ncbi:MAG: hypothetical protein OJF55_002627 [Rhodanobacteraceae bacterium]|nr:MAG: hypothetical protein OJF55_002627 [Rhodanobacteraceae bacterium]